MAFLDSFRLFSTEKYRSSLFSLELVFEMKNKHFQVDKRAAVRLTSIVKNSQKTTFS